MCGICGIAEAGTTPDLGLILKMTDTLEHRGPDGLGYWLDGPVALGMRRLAIIDLATGDQPIFNEDRTVAIVFNGEIFNYLELRSDLQSRGHRFVTQSDTETIVHAYEEWGEDCPRHLNGQFAFAIWDSRRQRLLLARDHLGIKPLYYTLVNGILLFASELKALRAHPACPTGIDPVGLDEYLALRYIPAPRTIYEGVCKLPAGHVLVWQSNTIEIRCYWSVAFRPEDRGDAATWAAELRALLVDAVNRQMMADVPVGAFLSGGIDSTIIVGLMAAAAGRPVRTFTVTFPGRPRFDESRYASLVAAEYGTEHQEIAVTADLERDLRQLVCVFDEPFADPAALPTLIMARATRRHVTVVLTGEGADELFAGYGWYRWAGRRWPLPSVVKRPLHRAAQEWGQGRRGVGRLTARLAPDFETMMVDSALSSVAPTFVRRTLYTPEWSVQLGNRRLTEELPVFATLSPGVPEQSRMQEADLKVWLEGDPLVKADRTTMAASLEARVPFLDYRLVELAARIPPQLQYRNGQSKSLLRLACQDLLPADILSRPKQAFDLPIDHWLRTDLRRTAGAYFQGGLFDRLPMLRAQPVIEKWHEHLAGGRNHGRLLWALLMLGMWANAIL